MKAMKKRGESFFGIHFDFHAQPGQVVPTVWRPEVYGEMLDAVKPDYVQCDTKGHAGLSSYPTRVGVRAAMRGDVDILRMMRDETAKRGIALYGHHSGLYDLKVCELHPDWCVVDVNGEIDREHASVFGPFVDAYLLPQLRELAGEYHLNGAWIDGECWGTRVDYSHWAVDAYRARYGVEPPRPEDDGYESYREFCREGFRNYVRHYVDEIHREYPEFEITSNWIWSAYMPEPHTTEVDFLSGDYSSANSVCSARFHGRILEARNMAWDLMAWGHNAIPGSWVSRNRQTKELAQYCQEAAMIIAMGGAFEFFNIHYGIGGTVQQWAIPIWARTAAFCRQRQICFGSRIRKELGVLFPCDRNAVGTANLYGGAPGQQELGQWLELLQDCQYSTKVLFEHDLAAGELGAFSIIVVPSTGRLSAAAVAGLRAFVAGGGRLVVDGGSTQWFEGWGGYRCGSRENRLVFVDGGGALATGEAACVELLPTEGSRTVGALYEDNIYDSAQRPAAVVGGGELSRVAALTFGLGGFYARNRSGAIRRWLRQLLETELGFQPSVRVTGSRFAELTVTEKDDGLLLVSLINVAGEHAVSTVRSYGEIPPIGPLTVTLAAEIGATAVRQLVEKDGFERSEMEGAMPSETACWRELPLTPTADGGAAVTVDRVAIHTVLAVTVAKD